MLPRIKQDSQPKDKIVKEEAKAQNNLQPMGNEAGQNLPPVNAGIGNEAMNVLLMNQMLKEANDQTGEEFFEGNIDRIENDEEPKQDNNIENEAPNKAEDVKGKKDLVKNFIDDIFNNAIQENAGGQPEAPGQENNVQNNNPPVQDVFPDQMEQKALFSEDPAMTKEEKHQQVMDKISEELKEPPDLPEDLIAVAPKKKKGKKSKKSGKSNNQVNNIQNNNIVNNDLNEINNEMQPAAGWNFNAQKLPERAKVGWFRRFLTGTAKFFGKTFGKAINVAQNLVRFTYFRQKYKQSVSGNTENPNIEQDKRQHDVIPGWDGKKYEKAPDGQDDIMADFRRVPTVWSRVTAGKAVDAEGKPLPPTISVNVNQPKEAVDKTMVGLNTGHSGLGIEYSRYSRISGQYERYSLKYGFYMAGSTLSETSLNTAKAGNFPGQLMDENDAAWTVSRKFPAKNRQVSAILKASETYADKGYNGLTRNCTTFVKDMVQNVAHIPAADSIFKMEAARVSSLGNFGIFAGTAHETNARINTEENFEKLARQKDMSYAGLGNMRVTKQDYRNYKNAPAEAPTTTSLADSPNAVAENMRRLEGPDAGTISSDGYKGSLPVAGERSGSSFSRSQPQNAAMLVDYEHALLEEGQSLIQTILGVLGKNSLEEVFSMPEMTEELVTPIAELDNAGATIHELIGVDDQPRELKKARADLDAQIAGLNTLLFKYFKNDKRLHVPVLHMISLLSRAAQYIDGLYAQTDYGADVDGDLGNIRSADKTMEYSVTAGDYEAMMTPSHYESYLQIYKSPQRAVKEYAEYRELKQIRDENTRKLTKEEKKKLEKAERIDKLADQFDLSHNYMLEKGSYTQQDVDYAFDLHTKENAGDANGAILAKSSGNVYKSLILEKIFGGMKQRYLNHISLEDSGDMNTVKAWLENDMLECVKRKKDDVMAVLRAMKRNAEIPDPDKDYLIGSFQTLMAENWIHKVFKEGAPDESPLHNAPNFVGEALGQILADNGSPLTSFLTGMIKIVLAEEQANAPDSLQQAKRK
ncbi:MAG: hypothetical protein IJI57_16555 [Flexilinea sp.]|nr:hypothetical protein [Flexilinea sp.]